MRIMKNKAMIAIILVMVLLLPVTLRVSAQEVTTPPTETIPFTEAPTEPEPTVPSTEAPTEPESAVPSTPIEFVNKLTEHELTPDTAETAFSTRALQAAQLMPVTLNCFTLHLLLRAVYFISFCSVTSSSSITSSFPARISSATQLRIWLPSTSRLNAFIAAVTAADCVNTSVQ